ncbi:thialysine N-epsilon-acetyltransferase-like isoform X2 [Girardinichthys multiradiatus]|uniref:thialysine N-epsilon-acetyltransferase-like isoform X2 n=1 Tax=Girardinichthys multiradiatus TaxID=208333 RepID=UPI001FACFF1E|nr:thialysine N-epsilon-acetyltransferase-like isoform X2 [Girardinichthys multiradiatus]
MDFSIRAANVEDCKDIARMIKELAEYEKVADLVRVTQRDLEQDGFSKNPFFHGIIAEVPEQHRTKEGKGIGKALMSKVAQLGLAAGCHQLNFTVLDWNKSSLDFYLSQGCFDITDKMGYHCMRCEGEALEHLAQP